MFDILVVEDDYNIRLLMGEILKDNGFHPVLAEDGIDALSVLDRQHIDLMITDVMMPVQYR